MRWRIAPLCSRSMLETEAFVVRGRILRERDRFLQVCFNEETGTTAFALIEDEQRIWGVDYDDLRGWHVHSVDSPDQHRDIDPMTPEEVVEALAEAWEQLPEPRGKPLPPSSTQSLGRRGNSSTRRASRRRRWRSPKESAAYVSPVSTSSGSTYSFRLRIEKTCAIRPIRERRKSVEVEEKGEEGTVISSRFRGDGDGRADLYPRRLRARIASAESGVMQPARSDLDRSVRSGVCTH